MRKQWETFVRLLRYYPRVLKLVWESNPRLALAGVLLSLASAAVAPAQIWMSKVLIDRVIATLQASPEAASFDWSLMLGPMALIFVLWVVGRVSRSVAEGIDYALGFEIGNHAEYLLLQKASQLDIAFFENPKFYDQMENAQREMGRARTLAWSGMGLIDSLVALVAVLALLFRLHPLMVVVTVLTNVPRIWLETRFTFQIHNVWTSRTSARRMVKYMSGILAAREPVKEMRLFGLHPLFLERHRTFWRKFVDEIKEVRFVKERLNVVLEVVAMAGMAAVWVQAMVLALARRITIGDVALAFQTAERGRFELMRFLHTVAQFYDNSIFITTFFDFLDMPPDAVAGALARNGHGDTPPLPIPTPMQQGIEFRHVSFRYPNAEREVLHDVSFTLRPGETVAVVGENGAGKTTLVKLLARLYDPTDGAIYLDGVDLREYDLDDLRRHIGVIFQDFVRYDLTARENIGFGQVEWADDLARVERAAEQGGATPVVGRLPKGFATMLGRTFDEGVDLSGGEWQKLALSRAFMREADILILDEPTAALDALAEYEVFNRFAELTAGKATVFISHRFSTVRMAHRILVLEGGRLTEQGSHAELMALGGQYARMFNTQAERYR